ncbi:MAG: MATE family efflux transporter [Clostridia bacterium]|nr:MATE family efflux transporter [Clostridia bacterium]
MKKSPSTLFDRAFWKTMLPLALPIALQNLLMTSFRLVDTLMIGKLGDVSIAAVGLAGSASFLLELLMFGLASGGSVFMAQYHGAKNRDGILRSYGALLLFALPVSLAFAGFIFFCPEFFMRILTDDELLVAEGARYLSWACFSYLGLAFNQAMSITLRSTENVRVPMIASGIAAALNALLNYVFIFGCFGIPAMGVAGAGLATTISAASAPIIMGLISARQKNILASPLKKILDVRGFLGLFWSRALPVLCNEVFWSLSIVGLNMVYGRMGRDNYAALTIFRTVENFGFVFFMGICNACNILVGKSIGSGRYELAKNYARRFIKLIPVLGIPIGILLVLLRTQVLGLFDISATAFHTAELLLIIYAVDINVRNIPYLTVVGVFRAGGDTRIGLLADMLVMYVISLPVTILCGLVWKLPFITTYLAMIVAEDLVKCAITLPHFFRMRWIKPVTAPPEIDGIQPENAGFPAP